MDLIDLNGNAYLGVNGVFVNSISDGYALNIKLRGDKEPLQIGVAYGYKGILPVVRDLIADKMLHRTKKLDLREHFSPRREEPVYHECSILKKCPAKKKNRRH